MCNKKTHHDIINKCFLGIKKFSDIKKILEIQIRARKKFVVCHELSINMLACHSLSHDHMVTAASGSD